MVAEMCPCTCVCMCVFMCVCVSQVRLGEAHSNPKGLTRRLDINVLNHRSDLA